MKKTRKIFLFLIVLFSLIGLVACGGNNSSNPNNQNLDINETPDEKDETPDEKDDEVYRYTLNGRRDIVFTEPLQYSFTSWPIDNEFPIFIYIESGTVTIRNN